MSHSVGCQILRRGLVAVVALSVILIAGCKIRNSYEADIQWTCPAGESIAFIKTGNKPRSLFILTQRGSKWVLRSMDGVAVQEVACGVGKAQPAGPIALSSDGNRCLVGWTRWGKISNHRARIWGATDCDIRAKQQKDITSVFNVLTYLLIDPFSQDGKWIALVASGAYSVPSKHLWLIRRQTGEAKLVTTPQIDLLDQVFCTYAKDGSLATYNCGTGLLSRGRPEHISPCGKYGMAVSFPAHVTPDVQTITIATQRVGELRVARYNIPGKTRQTIYVDRSASAREANIVGFQYADYSGEMTLNIRWPGKYPLFICKDGRCSKIEVNEYAWWRLGCGVAIWDANTVAVVEKASESAPDRIVILTLGK